MENPIKMDDLGVPISGNHHITREYIYILYIDIMYADAHTQKTNGIPFRHPFHMKHTPESMVKIGIKSHIFGTFGDHLWKGDF